jgi:hypothetical protein
MSEATNELRILGDCLQEAWRADHLERARRKPRRKLALVIAVGILFVAGGAAIASSVLKSSAEEAQGLLGGHLLFRGTHPTCEQLTATSFVCTLESVPTEMTFYGPDGGELHDVYLGFKTATVNTQHRVDGGCVATTADGRTWRCYLGQEAVTRDIIGASYLGAYQPEPPTG